MVAAQAVTRTILVANRHSFCVTSPSQIPLYLSPITRSHKMNRSVVGFHVALPVLVIFGYPSRSRLVDCGHQQPYCTALISAHVLFFTIFRARRLGANSGTAYRFALLQHPFHFLPRQQTLLMLRFFPSYTGPRYFSYVHSCKRSPSIVEFARVIFATLLAIALPPCLPQRLYRDTCRLDNFPPLRILVHVSTRDSPYVSFLLRVPGTFLRRIVF